MPDKVELELKLAAMQLVTKIESDYDLRDRGRRAFREKYDCLAQMVETATGHELDLIAENHFLRRGVTYSIKPSE